jgi:hypothetical protein
MQAYAEALGNRRRDEVAAAYAASGATIIFNGVRRVLSFEEIALRYRDAWSGSVC